MKIVIDEKIPYLRDALEEMGHTVLAMPGDAIAPDDVADADALFVRTRTRCNGSLLAGSKVRFIGTATIGYDHIDAEYCAAHAIEWHSAPGCNADAVLQYVQSSLFIWAKERGRVLEGVTIGVVGVGEIGGRVAKWAESAGMRVLKNDPPRAARGDEGFLPLEVIAKECDVITFHPTLSKEGPCPSYHLADEAFFDMLCRKPLIINASRGPVVDNDALLSAMESGKVCDAVVDVWEGEPAINRALLERAFIATPHIAGYSAEGKRNATRQMIERFASFTGYSAQLPAVELPAPSPDIIKGDTLTEVLLKIYNPLSDTACLKTTPAEFENLRNNYKLRREPGSFVLQIGENVQW